MSVVINYVRGIVPLNWISTPSGWTHGNCPMCVLNGEPRPDEKGRGGFMFEDDSFIYNCFNCKYKVSWRTGYSFTNKLERLLSAFGTQESDIQRLKLDLMREGDISHLIQFKSRKRYFKYWLERY